MITYINECDQSDNEKYENNFHDLWLIDKLSVRIKNKFNNVVGIINVEPFIQIFDY